MEVTKNVSPIVADFLAGVSRDVVPVAELSLL
jgi:hypothetical protein